MAYPFAAAEVLTAVDLNAMIGAPTQNAQTGTTYTAVLLDAGKTVTLSNASAVTLTIPAQASVSWADNTQLNFLNLGAGTVTITPAADVTINGEPLTLETSKGGSLVRTASNTWTFTPTGGGGKVLQVVSVTKVDVFTTTSTSFVDVTGLTVSITPSATSSKILIMSTFQAGNSGNTTDFFNLVRDSTALAQGTGGSTNATAVAAPGPTPSLLDTVSISNLDSPATTSATTYKIQMKVAAGTGTVGRRGLDTAVGVSSNILVMEISA